MGDTMERKLPKVFANNLSEIHNNNTVFYSADDRSIEEPIKILNEKPINQKINDIFNSSKYIYKIEVELTLDSGVVVKKIIGRNRMNLITMDNEVIPINTIKDIRIK